jgi:hypothetical protein
MATLILYKIDGVDFLLAFVSHPNCGSAPGKH